MGVWGSGSFGNDAALDFVSALNEFAQVPTCPIEIELQQSSRDDALERRISIFFQSARGKGQGYVYTVSASQDERPDGGHIAAEHR